MSEVAILLNVFCNTFCGAVRLATAMMEAVVLEFEAEAKRAMVMLPVGQTDAA